MPADGDMVAAIGENRKMLIFPLEEVNEMARGKGVRLQRYKDGGLSDVRVFSKKEGLSWLDPAGRTFTLPMSELRDWVGERAQAGRMAPRGFPEVQQIRPVVLNIDLGALPLSLARPCATQQSRPWVGATWAVREPDNAFSRVGGGGAAAGAVGHRP